MKNLLTEADLSEYIKKIDGSKIFEAEIKPEDGEIDIAPPFLKQKYATDKRNDEIINQLVEGGLTKSVTITKTYKVKLTEELYDAYLKNEESSKEKLISYVEDKGELKDSTIDMEKDITND